MGVVGGKMKVGGKVFQSWLTLELSSRASTGDKGRLFTSHSG